MACKEITKQEAPIKRKQHINKNSHKFFKNLPKVQNKAEPAPTRNKIGTEATLRAII